MPLQETQRTIEALTGALRHAYHRNFGDLDRHYADVVAWVADMAIERIANSDALYHNVDHTVMVTMVGVEILRGKHLTDGGVEPRMWANFLTATLCHDIGYVRGVCRGDGWDEFVVDIHGQKVRPPPGASDVFLTPYHVERGKIFVAERFAQSLHLDVEEIQAGIDVTRFPVPEADDKQCVGTLPSLVRAADLIGQMADPHYMRKINALYYEFQEIGVNERLGYKTPADLAGAYPGFFWKSVRPYIVPGMRYLEITAQGRQWIANLYAHVFAEEHREHQLGPQRNR